MHDRTARDRSVFRSADVCKWITAPSRRCCKGCSFSALGLGPDHHPAMAEHNFAAGLNHAGHVRKLWAPGLCGMSCYKSLCISMQVLFPDECSLRAISCDRQSRGARHAKPEAHVDCTGFQGPINETGLLTTPPRRPMVLYPPPCLSSG